MRPSPLPLLFLASVALLSSCEARFDWPWLKEDAQVRTAHQGVASERTVGPFTRLVLNGVGTLVFDASVPAGVVRIQAEEGALDSIQTIVTQDTLTIDEEGLHGPGGWNLEFRVAPPPSLEEITLGGVGNIESQERWKTDKALTITIQGVGKINLDVEAPTVILLQKGSGELVVKGSAGSVQVVAQGLGKVDSQELTAKSADVLSQGVGEVSVYASEKLKVRAQGLGAVHFFGNPPTTDVQTEGLTQVSAGE